MQEPSRTSSTSPPVTDKAGHVPLLSGNYHAIAPDYPGFGHSDAPFPESFSYAFAHLADCLDKFTEHLGLARYLLYLQDYGAPVGFRLAIKARLRAPLPWVS